MLRSSWIWSVFLFLQMKNRDFGPLIGSNHCQKRNLTDEDLKQFENYLENPSESTRLVIFAEGKLDSKRRLVKLLKRDAQIIEATTPKEQDLKRYFSGQAQELGYTLWAIPWTSCS